MTAVILSADRKNNVPDMAIEDMKHISHLTLGNIAGEILQVSDLVEQNIVNLSDEFMKLVEYSRQQTDNITTVCNLLAPGDPARKILTETVAASADFHKNVNRMIYSLQFQDRARQRMSAIIAVLDILVYLSETIGNNPEPSGKKPVISEKNRDILNRLINATAHEELDHNYILKIFLGMGTKEQAARDELSDLANIEYF